MIGGVYMIACTATGKVYVGSAANLRRRWTQHKRSLSLGNHHSSHLQRAWDKYGEEAFAFVVLEAVDDNSRLIAVEQGWLDIYESYDRTKGYNVLPTAGSHLGRKRSRETRARLSAALRGKPKSKEHVAKMAAAMRGRHPSSETRAKLSVAHRGRAMPEWHKEKLLAVNLKDWVVIDPDGHTRDVRNLKAFCRENGLDDSGMRQVADGKLKQYKGWRCRRERRTL